MKQFHIAGAALKTLLLAGLLTACQHDKMIIPTDTSRVSITDRNAKTVSDTRLVKDGARTLQYVKSGQFIGRISKLSDANYYTEYSYNDNNGSSNLTITAKRYAKNNNSLVSEIKYVVSGGKCILSHDALNNHAYEYQYNSTGLLTEIKITTGAGSTKRVFSYHHNTVTNVYLLDKIITSGNAGITQEIVFSFGAKPEKYPLNPDYTGLDKYLGIFGNFSNVLVDHIVISQPALPNQPMSYCKFTYALDSDGYVTSKIAEFHPLGYGQSKDVQVATDALKYSTQWQGL